MQKTENEQTASVRAFGPGRRICAFLMCLALLIGLLPTFASAVESYTVSDEATLRSFLESSNEGQEILVTLDHDITLQTPITVRPGTKIVLQLDDADITGGAELSGPMFTVPEGTEFSLMGMTRESYRYTPRLCDAKNGGVVVENGGLFRLCTGVDFLGCKAE